MTSKITKKRLDEKLVDFIFIIFRTMNFVRTVSYVDTWTLLFIDYKENQWVVLIVKLSKEVTRPYDSHQTSHVN